MATKKQIMADPASQWNLCGDNEQVFVVRANDALAPYTIRRYAKYGQRHGMPRSMYLELMQLARTMEKNPDRVLPFPVG